MARQGKAAKSLFKATRHEALGTQSGSPVQVPRNGLHSNPRGRPCGDNHSEDLSRHRGEAPPTHLPKSRPGKARIWFSSSNHFMPTAVGGLHASPRCCQVSTLNPLQRFHVFDLDPCEGAIHRRLISLRHVT